MRPPSGPKIHAFTQIFFVIHAFTQVFLENHANPIIWEIGKIFGKNRGNIKKSGKFAQIWVKRENSRVHAKSRADSRIHAIEKSFFTFTQVFSIHAFTQFFFRFSCIHATKKGHSHIHANRWGPLYSKPRAKFCYDVLLF